MSGPASYNPATLLAALCLSSVALLAPALAHAQGDEEERAQPAPAPQAAEPDEPKAEVAPSATPAPDGGRPEAEAQQSPPAKATAATPEPAKPKPAAAAPAKPHGTFSFGSYGRVIAGGDGSGRPGRDADIVAWGSRLDHSNYVELELRRDDHWQATSADTRFVATLALGHPVFHYDGDFDARLAVRNLYLEETGLGLKGLSLWAGSRMLRGDDIYLLDFWPLDNLNTLGGGLRYQLPSHTTIGLHVGFGQPSNPFYRQQALRPAPLNQFGAATIDLLDRQRWVGSARIEQHVKLGTAGAGVKAVAYAEGHSVAAGQRETGSRPGVFQDVPSETGFVVGAELGAYRGPAPGSGDATHVNLFVRYAKGLAAYGEFANPEGLGLDRTTSGARELRVALGGNLELGHFAVMAGGYIRSFRNASSPLDFGDVDEGIVIARPQVWFTDWLGLGVEGSYQLQQRGVIADIDPDGAGSLEMGAPGASPEPVVGSVARVGVIPFLSPAGRGSYSRPVVWLVYSAALRSDAARMLYPVDDVLRRRSTEHFIGFGAEWWFDSSSYGGGQ